jgi:transposase InsO family protein
MRRGVLRVGDRVRHAGQDCTVTGLSGPLVRLQAEDGAESVLAVTLLQDSPDFVVVNGGHAAALPGLGLLAGVPEDALARARWWEQHLLEIETGQRRDGLSALDLVGGVGRELYDTEHTTIEQREFAKIEELAAAGFKVSHRTLQRHRSAYTAAGLWGLVDHRATRGSSPTGRVDDRVVEAVRRAMAEQVDRSTGTRTRLRRRVEALLDEQHGPGAVTLPPKTTFYRLLGAVEAGQHTFGAATTRRSLANRPVGPFGTVLAARPGELVQIDTTPLDVMALLEDGVSARVELTILVDLATRTICSGLLRPHGTKAVDAALLLARALVPEPMRPGWPDALRMRVSRLPHTELAAVDARLADAAAKPVITPETIVCDRGAVFLSETFLTACARLGISLQPAHPRTPTDKGVVERTFSSINTLFCQHVAGYTGRDPTRRARDVGEQAVWSLAQLQDLFDQWVLAGWQTRPHDGLRHPELPRSALSPNEMYAAQIAAAGYLPLALSGSDYLELLPVAWRTITASGIRVGSLTYDCAELNPYRGQPSAHRVRRGKWPVHHDPYDLGQVWLRRPDPHGLQPPEDACPDADATGGPAGWIEVPWIHRGRAPAPFADFTLRHTRRVLAERGDNEGQLAVAEALNALLTRAETGPDTSGPDTSGPDTSGPDTSGPDTSGPAGRTARRIAAKTRSAGPSTPNPAPAAPGQLEAVDGCGDLDDGETDDTDGGDDQSPAVDAVVVPFGVFDAHAEAKRFW